MLHVKHGSSTNPLVNTPKVGNNMTTPAKKVARKDVKPARANRSNPAKAAKAAVLTENELKLKALKDFQARQYAHMKAALDAGVNSQSQVISKVTDKGEVGVKLQGQRTDSVRGKAESSRDAQSIFTIVNSQNRQMESMVRYLWAVRNRSRESIINSLAPMAQGHEAVKAAMPESAFTDMKGVKRASFESFVSEAMRATVWAK